MNTTKKILAIVLAVVMSLCVCSVAVSAYANADDNDQFVLDTLLDNENYTSWQYVNINSNKINATMDTLTAFALYDSAWKNYATQEVNVSNAEEILLALIEKAEYSFDDGYVDEIISVLETASDVNDFIQKVNGYANIELFASQGWSTTFDVINGVIKVGNAYQEYRNEFIHAYAEVLSVQMANAYYIDMLQYVADNTEYDVLATAAENLIAKMEASVESVLQDLMGQAAGDGANMAFEYLAKLALNTNVYTATALKVYQIGTSVADVLWNTGDLYSYIDTVKTTYYFQSCLSDYTAEALDGADADKADIAVDMLLTTRTISEQALYDMKLAENKGIITAIKTKLYKTVYNDTEMMIAAVEAMREILADDENDNVVSALYVYGPAAVSATGVAAFRSVVSDFSGETLQVYFLTDTDAVALTGTDSGKVTLIMDVTAADGIEDWSFTEEAVEPGTVISFNTAAAAAPVYTVNGETKSFNDVLADAPEADITIGDVVDATTDVVEEKVKTSSFAKWIQDFFAKIAAFFTNLFKK